ncbi:type 1 glutamine amidotransferase [Actinophytocola oryzae]|uniref:GMP synthase-like glutamine amidotransferase n=1 Tax=Actinophytocola oryzae TaxID=502181 RepID=A0A4R7UPW2_9PSEU|nr:type 1 glutamine amidotransferase [Actinophytocola oryzae]TDV35414.1 GMP synthase-like glutamine amidotransferase [Actinophytocola oryzae]
MTPPRLLVIELDEQDPLGPLGDWLTAAGAELDLRRPADLPADFDGYAGLVCLGGHMGAYDDVEFPWLADVRRLLSAATTRQLPTLAICLGAQLLAVATGGQVTKGPDGPEVGPLLVAKRDVGWQDPLFADMPFMPDVMQFHSDIVERLPGNAALLASSTLYPHQAFRVGRCAYGLQFHIETTTELVESWAAQAPDTAEFARPGDLDHDRLVQAHADLEETWRPFAALFVKVAAGELAPATTPLPLIQH